MNHSGASVQPTRTGQPAREIVEVWPLWRILAIMRQGAARHGNPKTRSGSALRARRLPTQRHASRRDGRLSSPVPGNEQSLLKRPPRRVTYDCAGAG